jgi:hypothetical protein
MPALCRAAIRSSIRRRYSSDLRDFCIAAGVRDSNGKQFDPEFGLSQKGIIINFDRLVFRPGARLHRRSTRSGQRLNVLRFCLDAQEE